ncbi:MAG TPA: prepilin-type N-terminal cleavage/methylation domain-containing protein, partial [Patescibacteria group bacterium]|nr:prepilin-type N-terminal cleavage/methylation domain-containing protein [Patescibacteria group bacterium]
MFRIRPTVSSGFSLLEIILAVAIFATFSTGIIGVVLQGLQLNRLSAEETIASQYASEGLEAVKSIKNQSYSLLTDTAGTGLTNSTGVWALSGTNNLFDKY